MRPCFFIFGFGYTASFLATKLSALNFRVIGTTRDKAKIKQSTQYELIDFSLHAVKKYLPFATHILISTPPMAETGDPVLTHFADLISDYSSQIQWLGYLSTTGVYGDHQGAWVNELSASISPGKSGQLRLAAEQAWMSFCKNQQLPLHIFRLAGIYGPQRNALERILAGKQHSIYKEGHFFSRIHVDDIVSVLLASLNRPQTFAIYNVADDEPTPSHILDAYAATLLQRAPLPLIPYQTAKLSAMELDFYSNNRRVANNKIKQELQVKLDYPSYKQGLIHELSSRD
jgi:nucleoside-diphosphate-sugar epimerase